MGRVFNYFFNRIVTIPVYIFSSEIRKCLDDSR